MVFLPDGWRQDGQMCGGGLGKALRVAGLMESYTSSLRW